MANDSAWNRYSVVAGLSGDRDSKEIFTSPTNIYWPTSLLGLPLPKLPNEKTLVIGVNNYARTKLKPKCLSLVQAESLLYAKWNFINKRSFLIQDGTGVGKGRQLAAVIGREISDCIDLGENKTSVHIWCSQTLELADDALRDLYDIWQRNVYRFQLSEDGRNNYFYKAREVGIKKTLNWTIDRVRGEEEIHPRDIVFIQLTNSNLARVMIALEKLRLKCHLVVYLDYKSMERLFAGEVGGAQEDVEADDEEEEEEDDEVVVEAVEKKTTEEVEETGKKKKKKLTVEELTIQRKANMKKKLEHLLSKLNGYSAVILDESHNLSGGTTAGVFVDFLRENKQEIQKYLYASATAFMTPEPNEFGYLQPWLFPEWRDLNINPKHDFENDLSKTEVISRILRRDGRAVARYLSAEAVQYDELLVKMNPLALLSYRLYCKLIHDKLAGFGPDEGAARGKILGQLRNQFIPILTSLKTDSIAAYIENEKFTSNSFVVVTKYTKEMNQRNGENLTSAQQFVKFCFPLLQGEELERYPVMDDLMDRLHVMYPSKTMELTGRLNWYDRGTVPLLPKPIFLTNYTTGDETEKRTRDRKDKIALFQDDNLKTTGRLMLLGMVGSTGISLHQTEPYARGGKQRHMIFAEITDRSHEFLQFLGRVNRNGQKGSPVIRYARLPMAYEMYPISQTITKVMRLASGSSGSRHTSSGSKFLTVKAKDFLNTAGKFGLKTLMTMLDSPNTFDADRKDALMAHILQTFSPDRDKDGQMRYIDLEHRIMLTTATDTGDWLKTFPSRELDSALRTKNFDWLFGKLNAAVDAMFFSSRSPPVVQFLGRLALLPYGYQQLLFAAFEYFYDTDNHFMQDGIGTVELDTTKWIAHGTANKWLTVRKYKNTKTIVTGDWLLTCPLKDIRYDWQCYYYQGAEFVQKFEFGFEIGDKDLAKLQSEFTKFKPPPQ